MIKISLCEEAPAQKGDIIKVGDNYYKVLSKEELYYEFQNIVSGLDAGFTTASFPVNDLIPSKRFIYYITGFGIDGDIKIQLYYQSGSPRNTVTAKAKQRLDKNQAHYLNPFKFRFVVIAGDTLDVDIVAAFANVKASVWFYGHKFKVRNANANINAIELEDVRET